MVNYCVLETKQGFVALVAKDGRLTHSSLPKPSREQALREVEAGLREGAVEDIAALGDLPGKLRAYFRGERVDFSDVPLDLSAFGRFHAAAMQAARHIPYGAVATYRDLARMAGAEGAARAAGSAMARNAMPIVVPCHRVVASGGRIGGFSSGLEWKRALLEIEGVEI